MTNSENYIRRPAPFGNVKPDGSERETIAKQASTIRAQNEELSRLRSERLSIGRRLAEMTETAEKAARAGHEAIRQRDAARAELDEANFRTSSAENILSIKMDEADSEFGSIRAGFQIWQERCRRSNSTKNRLRLLARHWERLAHHWRRRADRRDDAASPVNRILAEVRAERRAQDAKHGAGNAANSADRWVSILAEETGEVAKAAVEGSGREMRAEAIQVAAVAVAIVEALDRGDVQRNEARKSDSTRIDRLAALVIEAGKDGAFVKLEWTPDPADGSASFRELLDRCV